MEVRVGSGMQTACFRLGRGGLAYVCSITQYILFAYL